MNGDNVIKAFIAIQILNQVPPTIKRKLIEKILKELDITLTTEEVDEFEQYFAPQGKTVLRSLPLGQSPEFSSRERKENARIQMEETQKMVEQIKRREEEEKKKWNALMEEWNKLSGYPDNNKAVAYNELATKLLERKEIFSSEEHIRTFFYKLEERGCFYMIKPGYYKKV